MFKQQWMEALSKVHYSVPLFIFVPLISYFAWTGLTQPGITTVNCILTVLAGLLAWTLTEYVMHRFIFHYQPNTEWGKKLHFIFHGVHHDYPNDAKRLVMPPSMSIPLATAFYFLFKVTVPALYLNTFFASFLTGYLCYDMFHYAFHHGTFTNPILKKLKQHHMQHHYADADRGYGVTSVLWDIIFRSELKK
jgi:sterol desaturase/sphingolipid hydroxylase (fatty acid hydroxylase superfamily)